jgi:hypothetical protein
MLMLSTGRSVRFFARLDPPQDHKSATVQALKFYLARSPTGLRADILFPDFLMVAFSEWRLWGRTPRLELTG